MSKRVAGTWRRCGPGWVALFGALILFLAGCGGGGGGDSSGSGASPMPNAPASNRARFGFDCDLNGVNGVLTMDVEIIANFGVTFGTGPAPSITGVISAGSSTIITAGNVRSPNAAYSFVGRDDFADFTDLQTNIRFRVQWSSTPTGLLMTVNPFGPGPSTHRCVLRSAAYL